ncbi:MAG: N-formylglutamate deformylase [Rhodospirillaceae bacterium]|nr:N-formylglutamate deformylase [Rhodospirillaceae bacterium]
MAVAYLGSGNAPQLLRVNEGDGPIILGQPHGGTFVPGDVAETLNETGQALADTDWHIGLLYSGTRARPDTFTQANARSEETTWKIERAHAHADSTVVATSVHRYVIDCNRPPDGASLYPGQNTTGLCPLTDFDGKPIYKPGMEPDAAEIERRRTLYHAPYHAALAAQIARVKAIHGVALVYDCHSIRSNIPYLFEGELPVLNIGTAGGTTCDPALEAAVVEAAEASGFSWVLNGRFTGGWTTRHYGRPQDGVHAIQMEIAQRAYMDEAPPWQLGLVKCLKLGAVLTPMLARLDELVRSLAR